MVWSMVDALFKKDETLRASISVPEAMLVPQQIIEVADVNNSELDWQFSQLPSQCDLLAGDTSPQFH